jgi:PAS domain S-box-containing protein
VNPTPSLPISDCPLAESDRPLTAACLHALALAIQRLLGRGSLDVIIPDALGLVGRCLEVDRVHVNEYHPDSATGAPSVSLRHEWLREAPIPTTTRPPEVFFNDQYKKISAGEIYSGFVSQMPETPRHALQERRVRSQLLIPILVRGSFWGYVGFEDHRQERTWTAAEQSLLLALAGSLSTTLSGRSIEEQVAARDSLLRGVAVSTGELLSTPDINNGLPKALAALGEAARVDRVCLFENVVGPGGVDRHLFARLVWSREGKVSEGTLRRLQNLDYDRLFPRWYEMLSSGRSISGRVMDFFGLTPDGELPPLRSILLVPIISDTHFWGLLGFDDQDVNRAWAAGDEAILNAMAGGIGGAISRQRAVDAVRASEEQFRSLIENGSDVIAILDGHGSFAYLSPSIERALGLAPHELLGHRALELLHPDDLQAMQPLREVMLAQPDAIRTAEFRLRRKDGAWHVFEGMAKTTLYCGQRCFLINARDITDRRKAEQALRQSSDMLRHSQKMEAVGRLAGGVAHDFNNLLTAIMGYADIMMDRLPVGHTMRHEVEEICKAADRAHALTRQLLAFSRKQVLETKVINLNTSVLDIKKMLGRLIGENIELHTELCRELGAVRVDPGQIEQVLINLVVNARDAMPDGGVITLCTTNVELAQPLRQGNQHVNAGHYVSLSVSDTGTGMSDEVQSHLFEPFFTTKEVGKGTGLGLSMVYGIVEQSGGRILFESAPGQGSTFTLYFPRLDTAPLADATGTAQRPAGGNETILLVEDEEMVRDLAHRILRERGYLVVAARSGGEALSLLEQHRGKVDLLLTDMVMPQMSGRSLAQHVQVAWPDIRVLYMSGYAQESAHTLDDLSLKNNYLQKPFPPAELARKVREVLDAH